MASALSLGSPWVCRSKRGRSRFVLASATAFSSDVKQFGFKGRPAAEVSVMVAGSTGYIGKFVVRELLARGYNVIAVARNRGGAEQRPATEGGELIIADVTNSSSLSSALGGRHVDAVVSCLASRGGGVQDSWDIDYQATRNVMDVGKAAGASHLVLLSAICVQKPLLEFQKAKLRIEAEMQGEMAADGRTSWSIVRPTAFFKSLGGQVGVVKSGGPFVVFGDGKLCSCKPISEQDLASFIADCVSDERLANRILPIGGPGKATTPIEQGAMLFKVAGRSEWFIKVPIQTMDAGVAVMEALAKVFPSMVDAAEYARIGRYYAVESMLAIDPSTGMYDEEATPSYGNDTLEGFFQKVVREGMVGQELGEQSPLAALLRRQQQ